MPRRHAKGRQGKDIGQRFNRGVTSGVTFTTIPSGVTLAKGGIQTNLGYMIAGLSDGILIVAGTTRTKGGVSQVFTATGSGAGAYFGLGMTTITSMLVSCGLETGVSQPFAFVSNDVLTPAHVTVHYNVADSGVSYGSAVSIEYLAIGT